MNDSLWAVGEAPARSLASRLPSLAWKTRKNNAFYEATSIREVQLIANHRESYGSKADAYIFLGFIPHDYSISSVLQGYVISPDVAGIITDAAEFEFRNEWKGRRVP